MNKRITLLLAALFAALTVACAAAEEFYTEMPPYLRMTQSTKSEQAANKIYIKRTYPQTASEPVNEEMRALVDEMAERNRDKLPLEPVTMASYLDVGAIITRSGTSWMSFLTLAEISREKEHLSVDFDARVYDIETGERIGLDDVFAPDSGAWALMAQEVRAQLSAAFGEEEPDAQRLDALCTREALEGAAFTLGAARLQLTYRADEIYPGKNTLLHVHLYYPDIREMMTPRAQAQTDNSRFRMIALTFDDGGARMSTRNVTDKLRQYGAQATFFIVGRRMKNNRDNMCHQHNAGYELQSHTYTHQYPGDISIEQIWADKAQFAREMSSIVGVEPTCMRAPGGNEYVYAKIGIGYPLLHWSVASGDSGSTSVERCAGRVSECVSDGDVVLMHDLNNICYKYTEVILQRLEARGYLFVTLEELFADAGTELEENLVYFSPSRVESGLE